MKANFELHTDVLVLGSGPSGFAAAYTAAQNGARVILVEQNGDVGGISTSGLMSHWTGSCGSPLFNEILKRSAHKNEGEFKDKITNLIDPEKLKKMETLRAQGFITEEEYRHALAVNQHQ